MSYIFVSLRRSNVVLCIIIMHHLLLSGISPSRACKECGTWCHIRCKKCSVCSAEFIPAKDLPLPPSKLERKHSSNLWKLMMVKVRHIYLGD